MWGKISAWCKHSATIAVSYALMVSGAVLEALPYVADLLSSTEVANALHAALPQNWVGLYNVCVGIVVYLARMRSLKVQP